MVADQIRLSNELPPLAMVTISDNEDYSVFPPINHENLDVFSNHNIPQSQSPPSSSSSSSSLLTFDCDTWGEYSPSLSPPFDSRARKGGEFTGWLSIGIQILRSKLISTVSSFRNPSPNRRSIWSFGIPAAAVLTLIMVLMRWKKNRRTLNETRLMKILKEKDEVISIQFLSFFSLAFHLFVELSLNVSLLFRILVTCIA